MMKDFTKFDDNTKAFKYIHDVLTGKIVTCELVKLACQRHISDLEQVEDPDYPFYFDKEAAYGPKGIITFAENLKHHKGRYARQKFKLHYSQHFFFYCLFGWKRKEDDTRRFTTSYKEVARKNAKTTECAITADYMVSMDGESGAQVYIGATKEEQARICFDDAKKINNASGLSDILKPYAKRIVYQAKGGFIGVLGRDSKTQDGFDPSCGIVDEYHAHKDDSILNIIESGMGARPQPLLCVITTAGFNKQGPCYQLRRKIINILTGVVHDDTTFGIIYTLDKDDDWEDPEVWVKSNPLLQDQEGIEQYAVSKRFIKERINKAKTEGESKIVDVQTKNLNVWTDAPETWIDSKIIKASSKGIITYEDLKGKKCYGGLDIGPSNDLTAFALLFVDDNNEPYALKVTCWIPEEKVRNATDDVNYAEWVNQGWLKEIKGRIIRHDVIAEDILEEITPYDFHSLAYDPYRADHGVITTLQDHEVECNDLAQTTRYLGVPTDKLEELIYQGKLELFNNPVLEWMFGNVVIYKDTSGNRKIDKKKSENKIDGVAASVNAIGEWITFKDEENTVDLWTM